VELLPRRLVGERPLFILHHDNNGRQPVESTSLMVIPRHRLTREFIATSVMFSKNGVEKMLELPSSEEGRRIVSPTSALGPLLTITRQGNLAACRTR
jgi:hypothetical protein